MSRGQNPGAPRARRKQVSEQGEWERLVQFLVDRKEETAARGQHLVEVAAERLTKLLPADAHVAYCWSRRVDDRETTVGSRLAAG